MIRQSVLSCTFLKNNIRLSNPMSRRKLENVGRNKNMKESFGKKFYFKVDQLIIIELDSKPPIGNVLFTKNNILENKFMV